jgi:hypothetical protein
VWFPIAVYPVYIKIPFAGVSRCSPALTALIFSPYSLPFFRSFGLHKSILDSSMEMETNYLLEIIASHLRDARSVATRVLGSPMYKMYKGFTTSTLEGWIRHVVEPRRLMSFKEFHSRNPHDPRISELLDQIERMSGFLLGVVVLFVFQYLMGYVETGRWNTYSNGAWEFRATYVCIELRLGSYPFQKFRETPRKYSGVTERKNRKTSVPDRYEPWVKFRIDKFYFQAQKTAEKAARIRDVAKFWLKIKGRKRYNFGEEDYNYLNFVQEFHPQQSDDEVKRLVLEHAQRFLKDVQQPQVPVDHPCVEPARFANGEDNTIQGLSDYEDMIEGYVPDDTFDMIEELQSVSPNLDIAGKYAIIRL